MVQAQQVRMSSTYHRRGLVLRLLTRMPAVDRFVTEREKQRAIVEILARRDVAGAVAAMQQDPQNIARVARAIASRHSIHVAVHGCQALIDFKNAGGNIDYASVRAKLIWVRATAEPFEVRQYANLALFAMTSNEPVDCRSPYVLFASSRSMVTF